MCSPCRFDRRLPPAKCLEGFQGGLPLACGRRPGESQAMEMDGLNASPRPPPPARRSAPRRSPRRSAPRPPQRPRSSRSRGPMRRGRPLGGSSAAQGLTGKTQFVHRVLLPENVEHQVSFRGAPTPRLWMDEIQFAPPKTPWLKP